MAVDKSETEYGAVPPLAPPRADGPPFWWTEGERMNRNTDPLRARRQANDNRSRNA